VGLCEADAISATTVVDHFDVFKQEGSNFDAGRGLFEEKLLAARPGRVYHPAGCDRIRFIHCQIQ